MLITIWLGLKQENDITLSSQSWLVGKELHTSEVPTLCAVIQKGIWERVLVELGKAKTESIQKI